MTRAFDPNRLQFYVTIPAPCPYLDDKMERKVFTQFDPLSGPHLNDYLTHSGFRRSQNVIYRPACESCNACKSLRIEADYYVSTQRHRRVMRKNAHLTREICEPYATQEQFALLHTYLMARHPDGGMADMDFARYETMVEDCASRTLVVEYRNQKGELKACCLTDEMSDGLSMVYSFYDPHMTSASMGTFMILDHINICERQSLPYLYLGYWVKGSRKMEYKAQFKPAQILTHKGWTPLTDELELHNDIGFAIKDLQKL